MSGRTQLDHAVQTFFRVRRQLSDHLNFLQQHKRLMLDVPGMHVEPSGEWGIPGSCRLCDCRWIEIVRESSAMSRPAYGVNEQAVLSHAILLALQMNPVAIAHEYGVGLMQLVEALSPRLTLEALGAPADPGPDPADEDDDQVRSQFIGPDADDWDMES